MSQDISKVILLGSVEVEYNGVDLGHTDPSTKVTVKTELVKAQVAKFGKSTVKVFRNGIEVMVEMMLMQTDLTNIQGSSTASPYPQFYPVSSGGNTKLGIGEVAGQESEGAELVLTPVLGDNTPDFDFTLHNAVPVGDPELMYTSEKVQIWKVVFEGVIDEGQLAGEYIGAFGDDSITQDAVAPVVSSMSPANDSTGQSVATNIVWTMSKALNGNTVNTDSVKVVATPGVGAGGEVAGTVTLVNNGASTTITFNPDSNLAATTKFICILENTILSQSGVALVTDVRQFTTT